MKNPQILELDKSQSNRPTERRIRIRIPKNYHQEPVISQIVSRNNLEVNILAAILGKNGAGDGWFDLLLQGKSQDIDSALIYLAELNIQIWHEIETENGW
ncbi:MAG: NIL domain-containing protein [Gomphosphaeria aponina SAG 52.96 = DSM 107014]|uniref:NIL domain-containing protein n=1 Tax=Gomphosphaeria aponina SAG 52.96 = DSM 107014 TaxID=1521640 RepID=A0A941GR44_9CHRO|nr:NIL domain-containing protein [Gomphosphaeria aponina SAG 52.96 = DSM 107014]